MKHLRSIQGRLMLAALVVALLFVGQAVAGWWNARQLMRQSTTAAIQVRGFEQLHQDLLRHRLTIFQMLGTTQAKEQEGYRTTIARQQGVLEPRMIVFEAGLDWQEMGKLTAEISKLHGEFRSKKAYELMYGDHQRRHEALMGQIETRSASAADRSRDAAKRTQTQALLIASGFLAVTVMALVALVIGARRTVVQPVAAMGAALDRLAHGDLSARVAYRSGDEVGGMAASFDRAASTLQEVIEQVARDAKAVAAAAEGLRGISSELVGQAQASTRQAAAAGELAVQVSVRAQAVAGTSASVRGSIDGIGQISNQAAATAKRAVEAVQDAERTMVTLAQAGDEISQAAGIIADIAGRTNLLALNATIEAASAGEAGKGFAVVAGEVKALARQSATATQDIATRIGAVQRGVGDAGKALVAIASALRAVDGLQGQVAEAVGIQTASAGSMANTAAEAAAGTTGIRDALSAVDRSATGTDAAARRTQEAADALAGLAGGLLTAVARVTRTGAAATCQSRTGSDRTSS